MGKIERQELGTSLITELNTFNTHMADNAKHRINILDYGAHSITESGFETFDSTTTIQNAINYVAGLGGGTVYVPKGIYKTTDIIHLAANVNICGEGEISELRGFFYNKGAILSYEHTNPVIIRDIKINRDSSVVSNLVSHVDNGIEICRNTAGWQGRGLISNIVINNCQDGFVWKGGSIDLIENVLCFDNRGHGFWGIDARCNLDHCYAGTNYGNGFAFYNDGLQDQGGCILEDCSSFANQLSGFDFETNSTSTPIGNFFISNCGASTNGFSGFNFNKPILQLLMANIFIETSGNAKDMNASFTDYPDASGINFPSGFEIVNISGIQILNCKGKGFNIYGGKYMNISNLTMCYNGRGGNYKQGLVVGGTVNTLLINGIMTRKNDGNNTSVQEQSIGIYDGATTAVISGGIVDGTVLNQGGSNCKIINVLGADIAKV